MQNTKPYRYHLATSAELKRLGNEWRKCPGCGKLEYKPYVDVAGEPIGSGCGRCNREIKCGYHVPPKIWLADNPNVEHKVVEVRPAKLLKPISMPLEWIGRKVKGNNDNVLIKWLREQPWNLDQRERLERALISYFVGTDKCGRTIWWQLDDENRLRSGKQMAYKADGHRDKRQHPRWIHTAVQELFPPDEYEYVGCLFGLHLINVFRDAEICLVESEKTAIICSAFWPQDDKLWLACGGLRSLNYERIRPILSRGKKIIAYPDHDGYDLWREKLSQIDSRIVVSDWVEQHHDDAKDSPTADIADILLRYLGEYPNPDVLTHQRFFEILKIKNPNFKSFIECLPITPTTPSKVIK